MAVTNQEPTKIIPIFFLDHLSSSSSSFLFIKPGISSVALSHIGGQIKQKTHSQKKPHISTAIKLPTWILLGLWSPHHISNPIKVIHRLIWSHCLVVESFDYRLKLIHGWGARIRWSRRWEKWGKREKCSFLGIGG